VKLKKYFKAGVIAQQNTCLASPEFKSQYSFPCPTTKTLEDHIIKNIESYKSVLLMTFYRQKSILLFWTE
jgi:hypothetical protein